MKTSLACLALAGSAAAFAPAQQTSFSTKLNSAVPEGYDDLIGEFLLLRSAAASAASRKGIYLSGSMMGLH